MTELIGMDTEIAIINSFPIYSRQRGNQGILIREMKNIKIAKMEFLEIKNTIYEMKNRQMKLILN